MKRLRGFGIDGGAGEMGNRMNDAPSGTVRRSAEGTLLVREFRGDKLGWKLVPSQSEHCVFFGDHEVEPRSSPVAWCMTSSCDSSR